MNMARHTVVDAVYADTPSLMAAYAERAAMYGCSPSVSQDDAFWQLLDAQLQFRFEARCAFTEAEVFVPLGRAYDGLLRRRAGETAAVTGLVDGDGCRIPQTKVMRGARPGPATRTRTRDGMADFLVGRRPASACCEPKACDAGECEDGRDCWGHVAAVSCQDCPGEFA